ncbi:general substrate transporter [Hanseniaspora valbyensis NRRL Y-1626]|uniref:General substrate transporter n=1 Tax=Hanseniaspora valbyensis NRRL Y-1626 TaxID=766949 RepID=A0A1B7TCS4_9ASCO|nr:general substrate transporter [Hanseniaspora valbyensis NRRL Y-1626]
MSTDSITKNIPRLSTKREFINCLLIATVGCTFGQDMGIAPTYQFPSFKANFKVNNTWINGIIVSIFNIGCAIGGVLLSKISDYKGRKFTIWLAVSIFLLGGMIQLIPSTHYGQIIAGRFISGLSVGTTAVVAPGFITESITDVKHRGTVVVFYQFCVVIGIIYGNIVTLITSRAYPLDDNFNNNQWRIPIGFGMIWGLIVIVGLIFVPESQSYYKHKEERLLMQRENKNESKITWTECFTGKPRLGFRLLLGCLLMFFQQASGINYFFYYGSLLFSSVGLNDSYVTSLIFSLVNFFGTIIGVYCVGKAGRKTIFLWGCIGGCIAMIIYSSLGSFALTQSDGTISKSVGGCMIAFTCLFIIFFAISLGPITFVLVSELYPIRTKSLSMGIATNCNWLTNFFITLLTPTITAKIGYKYGYVFVACLGAAIFFTYFFVPETRGLTSNEIDMIFVGKNDSSYYEQEGDDEDDDKSLMDPVLITNISSALKYDSSNNESLEKQKSPSTEIDAISNNNLA